MNDFYKIINKYSNHGALGGRPGDTGIEQNKYELNELCKFITENNIKSWLEIGIAHGELLRFMGKEMNLNAMGITLNEHTHAHTGLTVMYGSSRDNTIIQAVKDYVNENGKYGMIFVDGDHSYDGVKADYNNYKDLCTYMGFHDACGWRDCQGVPAFLNEIKAQYSDSYKMFEDQTDFRSGIAVIKI